MEHIGTIGRDGGDAVRRADCGQPWHGRLSRMDLGNDVSLSGGNRGLGTNGKPAARESPPGIVVLEATGQDIGVPAVDLLA